MLVLATLTRERRPTRGLWVIALILAWIPSVAPRHQRRSIPAGTASQWCGGVGGRRGLGVVVDLARDRHQRPTL
jgi:hypothetical protein